MTDSSRRVRPHPVRAVEKGNGRNVTGPRRRDLRMFVGMTHTDHPGPTVTRRRALQLAGAAAGVLGAGVVGLPLAATAWAGPALTAPATGFGLFEDLQYLTGTALTDRLDEFVRLGVGWARFQMIWANVQRYSPGSFDWGPVDALVAALVARNIRPLAVLDTSPPWASRAPGCAEDTCAPTDPAQFAAFAKTAAARYTGRVAAWEIWNEQNTDSFFRPGPDVAGYTALLRAVYPAIKGADPNATVLSGGVAPAATRVDGATISPTDFLQGIYDHGGAGFFDAVGWHPYCYPAAPGTDPGTAWNQMSTSAVNARAIMAAHGDGAKQIWATEFGAHTDPAGAGYLTEAQQSDHLVRGINLWRSYSWAGPMVLYQLRDRGTDTSDRENFFGLQRADGTEKPAYQAVVSAIRPSPAPAPEIHGAIAEHYYNTPGLAALFGPTITPERTTPDTIGRYNHFDGGDGGSIYWTPATGAWSVHGAIRGHWASLGWEAGPTGYPTTDERTTPDGVGRYNHFTGGGGASIYWTPPTGAQLVHGAIRNRWASMGWELSSLGYPVSDEYAVPGGRRSNFQHGSLTYRFSDGAVLIG